MKRRDLDSNIIQLPSGSRIEAHSGPDLDVLLHVLHGDGVLVTETNRLSLRPGALVWLPRHSRREIVAGVGGPQLSDGPPAPAGVGGAGVRVAGVRVRTGRLGLHCYLDRPLFWPTRAPAPQSRPGGRRCRRHRPQPLPATGAMGVGGGAGSMDPGFVGSDAGNGLYSRRGRGLLQEPQQLDGEGKHESGVLLRGDLDDGLQEPELQGGRRIGHHAGGLGQLSRGLQLSVGG